MNDRLPGTSYDNPIWHSGYRIWLSDYRGMQFVSDEDHCIYGYCQTVAECKSEIDAIDGIASEVSSVGGLK